MNNRRMIESVQAYGLRKVLSYLDSDPEKNIPKIIDWLIRVDKDDSHIVQQARLVQKVLGNNENNWSQLLKSLWTDIDNGVRRKLFENFLVNATAIGEKRQNKANEKNGCNIPWAVLLDPTSACNLNCIGCWASEYGNQMNMDYSTIDNIIIQGKELGIFFYIYSGGEPLVRKQDIIKLCEKHSDCAFLAFTNGTLIDETFANEMLRVQNFVPVISVEGFEKETDSRRGNGTYKSIIEAMSILKSKKLPFGISCCYTSKNAAIIGSEAYFDDMIAKGAKFAWYFTYMPVGKDAVPELMVTAQQREYMYHQIRKFRKSKPIFTMDFWNDGEYAGGCIAGGRRYTHINANGDIEPCAFIHYSDSSIYNKTLLEAFKSPLFMEYHNNQPFNHNHLRPCPLLDNPEYLVNMVEKSAAKSTELRNPEHVRDLCAKCENAAEVWAVAAESLWQENDYSGSIMSEDIIEVAAGVN